MNLAKLVYKGIFWRCIFFASVLLVNILVARFFKAVNSGWIYYIANYFSFIILIASLSLESGMGFFAAKDPGKARGLALFSIGWTLGASLILLLLLYAFHPEPVGIFSGNDFSICAAFYIPGCLLTAFFSALFFSRQNFVLPNLILTGSNIVLAIVLFAGELNASADQPFFLKLYFFNYLLQGVLLCGTYFFTTDWQFKPAVPSQNEMRSLFRFSLFALINNVAYFILYRIDYWFLKNTCQQCLEGDLGNYIQAAKMVQLFLLVPGVIGSAIFPRTASGSLKEVNAGLPVFSRTVLSLYVVVLLILAAIGKWFFPWIFGSSFQRIYLPFLLLIPGILALSVVALLTAYNSGRARLGINIKGSVLGLVIIVTGDLIFIPSHGIIGAALVSSTGYLAYLSYLLFRFSKQYDVAPAAFFMPMRGDWRRFVNLIVKHEKN